MRRRGNLLLLPGKRGHPAFPATAPQQLQQYITRNKMGVVCGELFAPSPFPFAFTPVESDKSQLCYRAHSEGPHLQNSKL